MSTLVAVAIIFASNTYVNRPVSVVIPLQKKEDCQIIQNQMRQAYGRNLLNFDCFGDTK